MRSDEAITATRDSADIGDALAWTDWTAAKVLDQINKRHMALMTAEMIGAREGYGVQSSVVTCTIGQAFYPIPDRAIGGALEKLEIRAPGQTMWTTLEKVSVRDWQQYDQGPTSPGTPAYFCIQDGFVELAQAPNAAFQLQFTFYIRPSRMVTAQSSTVAGDGSDGVDRGRITAINTTTRTVTVNAVPFDQLLTVPAAITTANQRIDIVHPGGTFACAMYSQPQTLAGSVFTLGGTDDMSRVQVGDYVRVAEQTDWPSNLTLEFHQMICDRAAMEILRMTGRAEEEAILGQTVAADLKRFRMTINPQVKTQPKIIPYVPMWARGRPQRLLP